MPVPIPLSHIRRLRLRLQQLGRQEDEHPPVNELLGKVAGVQAQDWPAALQGVGVRAPHLTATEVEEALASHRLARTWTLRGTLHLMAAEDAAWLVPFLGPRWLPSNVKRLSQLGFEETQARQGVEALREAMDEPGLLTKAEAAQVLEAQGLPATGQAPIHVLYRGALQGIFSLGPVRKGKPTYGLFADLVGPLQPLAPDEALTRLARCFLHAFGPAAPEDLASWSGLPLRQARQAWDLIAGERVEVEITGEPEGDLRASVLGASVLKAQLTWLDEPLPDHPLVNLLPAFDNLMQAYNQRELIIEPRYARRVNAGGGMIHPVVLVDGFARGTWKLKRTRGEIEVVVEPFEPLPPDIQPGLDNEITRLKRFLGD